MGKIAPFVSFGESIVRTEFIVVKGDFKPILGLKTCEQMNFIQQISTINNLEKS